MKILKILYYYYFTFYKKVDDEPHAMTVFALSFSQALLVIFVVQIFFGYFYCYFFGTWPMIIIMAILIVCNYFIFIRTGMSKKLVKSPPPFIINQTFTKGFVILFFFITFSFLFLTAILTKSMLQNCR
jgi:hypothetical protein